MKKVIAMILAVVLIIGLMSCVGPKGAIGAAGPTGPVGTPGANAGDIPANATILMNQNFDDQAVGVTPTTSAGAWSRMATWYLENNIYTTVTNTAFVSFNKSFMVKGMSTFNFDRDIVKSPLVDSLPSTITGKVNIYFYVNKDTAGNKGFCFYINQYEKARFDLTFDGKINVFTTVNTFYQAGTYTTNLFVKYAIIINLDTQKFDVYANNIMVASNIPCSNAFEQYNGGAPISSSVAVYTTFFGIMTQLDANYDMDTMYIDNVLIYYTPN
jgi:hypothetical protein